MIAARFALYGVLSGLFGLSAFCLYGLPPREHPGAPGFRHWLIAAAVLALLISPVALALQAASMSGAPPWPIDLNAVGMILSGTAMGVAWEIRMAALTVAAVAALFAAGSAARLALVALVSGVALATLAWSGHGAMADGPAGWTHLVADILHILAAGAWVGALLGLGLLLARPARGVDAAYLALTCNALHGFRTMGTILVGTVVVTGIVNAWLLVGPDHALDLGATLYGRLLIAKLLLFLAMLGLAWLNRFRLTPALQVSIARGDHAGALAALRLSIGVESACVVLILALVAWLGTLEPPASAT